MRSFLFSLLLFLIIATSQVAESANDTYAASLRPLLNENPSKNGKLGVVVKSLTTGETIFEHNPHKMYIPASNEKIII